MAINCHIVNFRLNVNHLMELVGIAQFGQDLTLTFNSPANASAFFTAIGTNPYKFFVFNNIGELVQERFQATVLNLDTVSMTATQVIQSVAGNPPIVFPDPNFSGGECRYYYPRTYTASVDEITDLRIRGQGRLETRTIDIEGRWIGASPKLLSKGRYRASMLADAGEWVDGTYKHIPRVRSRFGLETYFGTPLLGVFDLDDLIEPDNLQPIDDQARPLGVTLPRGLQ
jgi:hypothetical protein